MNMHNFAIRSYIAVSATVFGIASALAAFALWEQALKSASSFLGFVLMGIPEIALMLAALSFCAASVIAISYSLFDNQLPKVDQRHA